MTLRDSAADQDLLAELEHGEGPRDDQQGQDDDDDEEAAGAHWRRR
jgi:hypothetical protein